MIRTLIFVLFLALSLPAQCFGTHPGGVTAVASAPNGRCTDIPGTANGPWCSLQNAISASTGGPLFLVASNLPLVSSAPVFFPTSVYFDFVHLPTPAPLPSGCVSAYVPGTFAFVVNLSNTGACQASLLATLPPLPGFAGVQLYGQAYMYDTLRAAWASSDVFRMTFQP